MRSDRGKRVIRFKRQKVLQLFLKRGEFWEEIQSIRRKWEINAKVAVPSGRWSRMPPGFKEASPWEPFAVRWDDEISGLIRRVVPPEFPKQLTYIWHDFFDTCVLYDPPETQLLEFADVGGPRPMDVKHPAPVKWPPENDEELGALLSDEELKMVAPPVAKVIDADEAGRTERWRARALLDRVNERHLKPQGIDLWDLVTEVWGLGRSQRRVRETLAGERTEALHRRRRGNHRKRRGQRTAVDPTGTWKKPYGRQATDR